MERIFIGLMICLLFLNCTKREGKNIVKNKPYIISKENRETLEDLKKRKNPPPPSGFYSYNNLIIDKKGDFYFYQKEYNTWNCIPSDYDTIPDFRNIEPIEIVKIPKYSVVDFIKQNVTNRNDLKQTLIIASQNDTVKSNLLLSFLNQNQLKSFAIRRTTQEEDTVLEYKKNNKFYNSEDIKWDQDRITLPLIKPEL